MTMNNLLNPSFKDEKLQAEFLENGYVILNEVIADSFIDEITRFFFSNIEKYALSKYISTIELTDIEHRSHANDLFYYATKDLLSNCFVDYQLYYGGLGIKFNRSTTELDPHQDSTMVPYDSNRTGLTIWFSLHDVNTLNGCVHVIPGSHTFNRQPRATICKFPYSIYKDQIIDLMIPLPLRKGEVLIMDQSLFHYSSANQSEYVRVAAMGMIKPKEDNLVFYFPHQASCDVVEEYVVDIDFYLRHNLSTRPAGKINRLIQRKDLNLDFLGM